MFRFCSGDVPADGFGARNRTGVPRTHSGVMTTHTKNDDDAVDLAPPKATLKQWMGLTIMVVPLFMLATDVTVLFLAMPSIAADLLPVGSQQLWILHIGEFLSAATMITFGLLAGRIGARKLLLGAVAVYGAASLIAAYAVNAEMLIGGRALLGIAAAAFTPAGMVLVRRAFRDPKQYSIAFAIFMAAFTGGMAAGPPLGGFILEHFWWGAVFLINVPIAAILLIGGPFLLECNHADRSVRIDGLSVALSIAAILALVFGLQELSAAGFTWLPLVSTGVGLGLLWLFLHRQSKTAHPLLDLQLFRIRTIRIMLVVLFVGSFAMALPDMLLPQYLQLVRELSPLEAGLVLLAPALGSTVGSLLSPLLAAVKNRGLAIAIPLFISGIAIGMVVLMLGQASLVNLVIALTVMTFVGSPFMILVSQLMISAAPEEKTGPATAVQDVTASLSMGASIALLGAGALALYRRILGDWAGGNVPAEAVETSGESFGASAAVLAELPAAEAQSLIEAVEGAFTRTLQAGYGVFAIASIVLGVVVIFLLRRSKTS